jgi:hypothetical protein
MNNVLIKMNSSVYTRFKNSISEGIRFISFNALFATLLALIMTFFFELSTPYLIGSTTEMLPPLGFVIGTLIFSIFLQSLGLLLLNELNNRSPLGLTIWRISSILFLIAYGIIPIVAGVVNLEAGIVINILHLSVGLPAILKLNHFIEK